MVATPKYAAIAAELRERIERDELTPGERLPAQHALADEFGVTVMTLRQALAELERDGLIRTAKGTGTFVADRPAVRLGLGPLWSFAQEMEYQGTAISTDVLAVHSDLDGPHDATVRSRLALDDADDVVEILRRRTIDGVRVVVQRSALSGAVWRRIEGVDLTTTSLYDALAEHAGLRVDHASETFRAVAAGDVDAELLGVPTATPCLESTRLSFSGDVPFLHDRALLLGSAAEVCAERTATGLRLGYRATG